MWRFPHARKPQGRIGNPVPTLSWSGVTAPTVSAPRAASPFVTRRNALYCWSSPPTFPEPTAGVQSPIAYCCHHYGPRRRNPCGLAPTWQSHGRNRRWHRLLSQPIPSLGCGRRRNGARQRVRRCNRRARPNPLQARCSLFVCTRDAVPAQPNDFRQRDDLYCLYCMSRARALLENRRYLRPFQRGIELTLKQKEMSAAADRRSSWRVVGRLRRGVDDL